MPELSVPQFAVVGHPNEGKSSVLSTLAEDDSVRVSPTPGETTICRDFPVLIDGVEVIRFIDTPGFQNPTRMLHQIEELNNNTDNPIDAFRSMNIENPEYKEDCELLRPLIRRSGIIYVVDGARPVRNVDKAEMEVLRITGLPRIAIINSKEDNESFLEQWKNEFRKCFNTYRVFNAHQASYAQRIELLNCLRNIDQDWDKSLQAVIQAFKNDWSNRNNLCVEIILDFINKCLTYKEQKTIRSSTDVEKTKVLLYKNYIAKIKELERTTQQQIRSLFKHNIFNYELPPPSILQEDLFSEKTWKLLGLNRKQLMSTALIGGAGAGAAIDVATSGISFGVFSAIGGVAGAGSALLSGRKVAQSKILGVKLGREGIQIGPCNNVQLLYILLDRCLIYYSYISNWAHGCRDYDRLEDDPFFTRNKKASYTAKWDKNSRKICFRFFNTMDKISTKKRDKAIRQFKAILDSELNQINSYIE